MWTAFCDEGGNTGTNHIDDAQPFFVLAGWFAPEHCISRLREDARAILAPRQRSQLEIKGADLIRAAKGRQETAKLIDTLTESGAFPFFELIHKRYSLAARFVDYFMEPANNPDIWPEWFATTEIRNNFTADIAELPLEVLESVQRAFRTGLVPDAERCAAEVRDALRSCDNEALARKVAGIIGRTSLAVAEFTARVGPRAKSISPNYAALAHALLTLGSRAQAMSASVRVVHDETSSFETELRELWELLRDLDPQSLAGKQLDAMAPGLLPLQVVEDLSFRRSCDEPLIQAADVLAAAVGWLFRADLVPGENDDAERRIGELVFAALFLKTPSFGNIVGGELQVHRAAERLRALVK